MSKDRRRASDDRLALSAVIVGATVAFLGRREPMLLSTGAVLGLAGVLLALRGERQVSARRWLQGALGLAVIAVAASIAIERYQEWTFGQWFGLDSGGAITVAELRRLSETANGARIAGLGFSLALLLGALVNRMR